MSHKAEDFVPVPSREDDIATVLRGFQEGRFIRNTARDNESMWAIELLPFIAALSRLAAATRLPNPDRIYTKADVEAACGVVLAGYRSKPMIAKMVDRFLAWSLPASVCSDACVVQRGYPHRIGTNLLTADEARQMLEHVLQVQSSLPNPGQERGAVEEYSPLVQRAIQRLRDNIARRETNEDVEALKAVLIELATLRERLTESERLRAELEKDAERLREIEHAAWHVCESSEERVVDDEIVVTREDFEKLCSLLGEEHPITNAALAQEKP